MPSSSQRIAERRRKAAEQARQIVGEYVFERCNCEHCGRWQHIRRDFDKIASNLDGQNGLTGAMIWIMYKQEILGHKSYW